MRAARAVLVLMALTAAVPSGVGAPPAEPGALLVAGENDAEWQSLFARLAPTGAVLSEFTERRFFSFRQRATELRGEMRLDPQHGLSLRYVGPDERILIVDDQGVLQRDASGRSRALPADPQATATSTALLPVLRFDREEILRRFEIRAARDGDDWRFDFVPRDAGAAQTLGRITALGRGDELDRLEIRRNEKQRIEIRIHTARRGVEFSEAEIKRFFR